VLPEFIRRGTPAVVTSAVVDGDLALTELAISEVDPEGDNEVWIAGANDPEGVKDLTDDTNAMSAANLGSTHTRNPSVE